MSVNSRHVLRATLTIHIPLMSQLARNGDPVARAQDPLKGFGPAPPNLDSVPLGLILTMGLRRKTKGQ